MTSHVIGPRRVRKFSAYGSFHFLPRKIWIQTWFCDCLQYLCVFHNVFEFTLSIHDQGLMFSQINFFVNYFPHRIIMFLSTKFDVIKRHNKEERFYSSHVSKGFSQIAFPIISVQEEQLGLRYWTMI